MFLNPSYAAGSPKVGRTSRTSNANLWIHGVYMTIRENRLFYWEGQSAMNEKHEFPSDVTRLGEEQAFRRAARWAREIAARTGTPLVIYRDGKVEKRIVEEAAASASEQNGPPAKTD